MPVHKFGVTAVFCVHILIPLLKCAFLSFQHLVLCRHGVQVPVAWGRTP